MKLIKDLGIREYANTTHRFVLAECFCGRFIEIPFYRFRIQKSCGCRGGRFKHGLWKKNYRLINCWFAMIDRCYNPQSNNYKNYGAKGISICEEWKNSKEEFFNWSVENGYQNNLTIDRINSNGNYEPLNCHWVTQKENNRNRNCVKLTLKDAQDIRNAYLLRCFTQKEIAVGYNVSNDTICRIIKNRIWI